MIWHVIIIIIFAVIGFVLGRFLFHKDGELIIDTRHSDGDIYKFDLYTDFDELKAKNKLYLKIRVLK